MVEDRVCEKLGALDLRSTPAKVRVAASELTKNNTLQAVVIQEYSLPECLRVRREKVERAGKEEKYSFLGFCDDIPVGTLLASMAFAAHSESEKRNEFALEIESICVLPAFRRMGVAKALIDRLFHVVKSSRKLETILIYFPENHDATREICRRLGELVRAKIEDLKGSSLAGITDISTQTYIERERYGSGLDCNVLKVIIKR